jgi:hypothetical protein
LEVLNFLAQLLVDVDSSVKANSVDLLLGILCDIFLANKCVLATETAKKHVELTGHYHASEYIEVRGVDGDLNP